MDDASPRLEELVASWSGVGFKTKMVEPTCILALVERLLCRVRSSGTVPLAWHHSSGVHLHKSNKPGPKGRRVVHVLPSLGKQFFKALMRRKPNGGGLSQPEPADWLDGYISGRIRESTLLIERIGLKSLTAFHDLTNAFGSFKREAMDRAVASLFGPNALIGQQRFRSATTTIPGRDGDITLKTGEGGLMGDPLMVWVAFYNRRSAGSSRWRLKVRNLNNCWRGTRGRERGSTSLCRSMLMTQRSRLWQNKLDVLDGALAKVFSEQGQGEAPHAFGGGRFFGRSSASERRSGATAWQSRDGGLASWQPSG